MPGMWNAIVAAVFSTFNVVDKDGDLTLPGAIKDGTEVVISGWVATKVAPRMPPRLCPA
mgnify:CR=1 FL=1